MKKVALFAIFGLLAIAANAANEPKGTVVKTTCDKMVMTAPSDVLNNNTAEYREYLSELNEAYCGTKAMPKEVTDRY